MCGADEVNGDSLSSCAAADASSSSSSSLISVMSGEVSSPLVVVDPLFCCCCSCSSMAVADILIGVVCFRRFFDKSGEGSNKFPRRG